MNILDMQSVLAIVVVCSALFGLWGIYKFITKKSKK